MLAPVLAVLLSLLGSYIVSFLGFFTLFLAPLAGVIIAEAVKRMTRGRRSKTLFYLVAGATVAGSLPLLILRILPIAAGLAGGGVSLFGLLPLTYQAVYTLLSAGSVYYRMTGISL